MDFDLVAAVRVLERTPRVLRALLADLPPAWTEADEGPGTWSAHVVLAHLVYVERTNWVPRAEHLRAHGRRSALPTWPTDGQFTATLDASGGVRLVDAPIPALLDAFTAERARSLAMVEVWHLAASDLHAEGEHPTLGRVTLSQLLSTWVAHDLTHIAQATRVMAKQYRDAVGPWRAMLPIMDR